MLEYGAAARTARRVVAGVCADAETGSECSDAAVLMTSELVTNAVLHGIGAVRLTVDAGDDSLRVEVSDDERRRPELTGVDDEAEGGRGMFIVDALSSAWGVQDVPGGKVVWFEIPTQP
ncbi:MAG: ATP-binding region ATPase domain protein [Frankiales bacterium]|jgi:anti-sigma regulatory factor (Ser/Thr protein kinase)|nr:ATP-binding region ATPase domain protein [Frankiales bacterium]